jgi:hypothetical protein
MATPNGGADDEEHRQREQIGPLLDPAATAPDALEQTHRIGQWQGARDRLPDARQLLNGEEQPGEGDHRVEQDTRQRLGEACRGNDAGDDEAERHDAGGREQQCDGEAQQVDLGFDCAPGLAGGYQGQQGDESQDQLDDDVSRQDGERCQRGGAQPLEDAALAIDRSPA